MNNAERKELDDGVIALIETGAGDREIVDAFRDSDIGAEALLNKIKKFRKFFRPTVAAESAKPNIEPLSDDELSRIREIYNGDFIGKYQKALRDSGYIASRLETRSLLHTGASRLLKKKRGLLVSWYYTGPTASGKSAGIDAVADLMWPDNVLRVTSMTLGVARDLGVLNHVFIVMGEIAPKKPGEDDEVQRHWRQLVSDREFIHKYKAMNPATGKYETVTTVTSGHGAIAQCGTAEPHKFDDQWANRTNVVSLSDNPQTTDEVLSLRAEEARKPLEAEAKAKSAQELWSVFDRSLQPLGVEIPFSHAIKPTERRSSSRRLINLLNGHVQISALLHQHEREKTSEGLIVATWDDYEAAYELVDATAPRTLETMGDTSRSAYLRAVAELSGRETKVTIPSLVAILGQPQSTVRGYVTAWLSAELIIDTKAKLGKAKIYQVIAGSEEEAKKALAATRQDLGLIPPEVAKKRFESPPSPSVELSNNCRTVGSTVENTTEVDFDPNCRTIEPYVPTGVCFSSESDLPF